MNLRSLKISSISLLVLVGCNSPSSKSNQYIVTGISSDDPSPVKQLEIRMLNAHFSRNWETVISLADQYVKMAPKDFLGWLEKGVALSAIGRYSEAIPLLQKSVDIEPKATRAWDELAFALEKSGDIVGAKNARTKAESYRQILSKQ